MAIFRQTHLVESDWASPFLPAADSAGCLTGHSSSMDTCWDLRILAFAVLHTHTHTNIYIYKSGVKNEEQRIIGSQSWPIVINWPLQHVKVGWGAEHYRTSLAGIAGIWQLAPCLHLYSIYIYIIVESGPGTRHFWQTLQNAGSFYI